jgi:hypothetical protein
VTDSNQNLGNKYGSSGINIWINAYYKEKNGKEKLNVALKAKHEQFNSLKYLFNEDREKMQFYDLAKSMRAQQGTVIEESSTDSHGSDVRVPDDSKERIKNRTISNSVKQSIVRRIVDKCIHKEKYQCLLLPN